MRLPRLVLLFVLLLWVSASQADKRTELHLFQYGRTNTDQLKTAFYDFRDLLSEKLPMLSSELVQEVNIPALSQLRLKPVTDSDGELLRPNTRVGSLDDKRRYWSETGALGVLTGYVTQQEEIPYVHTTFYWGKLRGAYLAESITLKLPVVGESFDSTYDSHSVATLYALAHEIKQDCSNVSATVYLLSEAHKRAQAVSGDFPEFGADLENMIVNAIDKIRGECSD